MAAHDEELSGPDLWAGVLAEDVGKGEMLLGHAAGEPVLLIGKISASHGVNGVVFVPPLLR